MSAGLRVAGCRLFFGIEQAGLRANKWLYQAPTQ
jgi:hypothetical protein